MKTLRIAQAALATILAVGINSNTYAFMSVSVETPVEVQTDLSKTVESLRAEIEAGETACKDMLAKIDAAIDDIDAKLDEGVENEDDYLKARDALSDMRYDLECIADQLTQTFGTPGPPAATTTNAAPSTNSVSNVGGGGGAAGGGSLNGLVMGGVVAGTAAAAADGSNSNPGIVASGSTTN